MRSLLMLSLLCAPVLGDHCRQRVLVQHLDTGLTVTAFALPVGVPLAAINPAQPSYSVAPQAVPDAEYQEFLAWRASRVKPQSIPQTAIQRSCVQCHSGPSPKGKLDLSGDLSDTVRLKSVGRIVRGEMPPTAKKTPLTADAVGKLIEELSTKADAVKDVPPPAVPAKE